MNSTIASAQMRILHFVAALTLLIAAPYHCSATSFRGLNPAIEEFYRPKGDLFACLDGLKTIKYENINDNYCDCFDGSDEPGIFSHPALHHRIRYAGHHACEYLGGATSVSSVKH